LIERSYSLRARSKPTAGVVEGTRSVITCSAEDAAPQVERSRARALETVFGEVQDAQPAILRQTGPAARNQASCAS
jgi:hypothetical protein